MTVALVEVDNLAANDPDAHPNPYVVFSSHWKTRTSTVKLNASNPQWNGKIVLSRRLIHKLHEQDIIIY